VTISGQGLVLERFGREDVVVRGDIRQLQYEVTGEGNVAP
jgi:hypothetical protein